MNWHHSCSVYHNNKKDEVPRSTPTDELVVAAAAAAAMAALVVDLIQRGMLLTRCLWVLIYVLCSVWWWLKQSTRSSTSCSIVDDNRYCWNSVVWLKTYEECIKECHGLLLVYFANCSARNRCEGGLTFCLMAFLWGGRFTRVQRRNTSTVFSYDRAKGVISRLWEASSLLFTPTRPRCFLAIVCGSSLGRSELRDTSTMDPSPFFGA